MAYSIDLTGHTALITGASSGLGAQFAKTLSGAGATVVLAARRIDRLHTLKDAITAQGGTAHAVALDVTDAAAIERAIAASEQSCGPIDILVNNAGVGLGARLTDVTAAQFDQVMQTNVRGAFLVAQAVGARMIARATAAAGPPYARVIHIASVAGLRAFPQLGVYGMSKAALIQMTRAMAFEWGRYGINVNAICPGYIDTEINHAMWSTEAGQKLTQMLPRKRVGTPHDLDSVLAMLCAEASHFINGAIITADDGHVV